jgi:hypothetical protein
LQPLYIVAFWCTYRIGSLLFSRRVGVWAAILVGLSFDYAFCSVEFRTDNLWAPLWLLCMVVLLSGALTTRRALIAGFLMGLCFGVSMKTLLLLMSMVIGGSMTLIFVGRERLGIGWGRNSRRVGSVLRQRVDCSCYDHGRVCALWHLAAVPLLGFRSQRRARCDQSSRMVGDYLCCRIPTRRSRGASDCWPRPPRPIVAARRSFVLVTAGFFITALVSFWPFCRGRTTSPFIRSPLSFVRAQF